MLERASTCFESGHRQLFRSPAQCLRTRRVLHSRFCHHAATQLSLPGWWAAASVLDQARAPPASVSRRPHGTFLDFLYPDKTLALLQRLAGGRRHVPETRRRRLLGAGVRPFSSAWGQPRRDEGMVDAEWADQAKQEMDALLRYSSAETELRRLLQRRTPGKQELAWQLYSACPGSMPDETVYALQNDLLEYLSQDRDFVVPRHLLHVFSQLPLSHRRTSSYRAAIVAYIALRMVGPAIQLFEEVCADKTHDTLHIGTEAILRRTIFDDQWDLSLRVFKIFLRQTPTLEGLPTPLQIRRGHTLNEIWGEITYLPELLENLDSFFHHVREFQHELKSSAELVETLSCFVMTFVPHVMDHVLDTYDRDEDFIQTWFVALFDTLHSLDLPTSACYEYAIKRMLALPRYQGYTHRRPLWRQLYERYRSQFLSQPEATHDVKPSRYLITEIIYFYGYENSLKQIDEHVKNLRSFYPNIPLKPGLLKFLIRTFADNGEDAQVVEHLNELQKYHAEHVDLKVLSSLLFVYARRADVDETTVQFRRIYDEFGLVPDTACWNMLLLAYVRADDLEGSLECFNQCTDSGAVPDLHTFGPLLDFCARRGDVEAFETLFTRAKQMGIPMDTNVRARSGYVQAFLNAGDAEGAEAIAQGMLKSWQAGSLTGHPLTHTWNLLIQHHALNMDIASSRECYRQMVENDIPLNAWTYGSLMRALIEVNQTNAAYKILRVTMAENNIKVYGLHYAIVMTGFLREGQVDLAVDAYERMIRSRTPQTESSRQASIKTLGIVDLARLRKRKAKHPNYRLLKVEQALQEMLITGTGQETAHRGPRHSRQFDLRNQIAVPQAYYGLLISLYTTRGAHAVCKKLIKQAEKAAPNTSDYTTSITLTATMMEAHRKAGEYAEVARCWELALDSASKLTKTLHQALYPEPAGLESDSLIDPIIRERFEQSHIANNRRQVLIKPLRIYIRSLLAQPEPSALQEAQRTIRDLLVKGFAVDVLVWNEFISALAQRNRLLDAFTICEAYLMPRFPGWRNLDPKYIRHDRPGYQLMEIRHHEVKKTTTMPRYKTLIILAKAYGQARQDERNGIGYDATREAWIAEILEDAAPMTIRAIQSMPRTHDRLQREYFHDTQ